MPPDPELLRRTTPSQRIALWFDLMRTADKLLLAGMRHRLGPEGGIREEYRRWYADQMREHDEGLILMLQNLHRAETLAAKDVVS